MGLKRLAELEGIAFVVASMTHNLLELVNAFIHSTALISIQLTVAYLLAQLGPPAMVCLSIWLLIARRRRFQG